MSITQDFVLDPHLALHLPLYRLDGNSLVSRDTYGRLVTVTGALWTPQGRVFDGIDDYILLSPNYIFTSNHTLEFWAKIQAQDYMGVVSRTSGYYSYVRFSGPTPGTYNTRIHIETDTDVDEIFLDFDSPISVDQFYHFVITEDNSNVWRLYINGVLQIDTGVTVNSNLTIGRIGEARSTDNFKGTIGEMRIYSRLLTPLEIQRNYLATKWRYR